MSVESLFHEVRSLIPGDREAFLEANCTDPAERRRIEELLKAHDAGGGVLDQPVATGDYTPIPAADDDRSNVAEQPGMIIGPYKLLQKLGEGGMGAVWAAEQSTPVKRRVALKLIKAGMDSTQV